MMMGSFRLYFVGLDWRRLLLLLLGKEGKYDDAGDYDDEVEVIEEGEQSQASRCLKDMEVGAVVGEEIVPNEPDNPKVERLERAV